MKQTQEPPMPILRKKPDRRQSVAPMTGQFTPADFAVIAGDSQVSADAVMPLVLQATGARSVIDLGCGIGTWLSAAERLGVTDYQGIDGDGATSKLLIPASRFRASDLRQPFTSDRRFDLAVDKQGGADPSVVAFPAAAEPG